MLGFVLHLRKLVLAQPGETAVWARLCSDIFPEVLNDVAVCLCVQLSLSGSHGGRGHEFT
eukprot:10807772-Lingulodinium_polyedra.AAC.1